MIKIIESKIGSKANITQNAGEIIKVSKEGIEINTGEGTILIVTVKPESKGIMRAYDYANGAKLSAGDIIGV